MTAVIKKHRQKTTEDQNQTIDQGNCNTSGMSSAVITLQRLLCLESKRSIELMTNT